MTENKKPTVFITPEAEQRLKLYARCAPGFMLGLGVVEEKGDDFLVQEVILLHQTCGGPAWAVCSSEDILRSIDPNDYSRIGKMRARWAVQNEIGLFWGDSNGIDLISRAQIDRDMIALLVNEKGEQLAKIYRKESGIEEGAELVVLGDPLPENAQLLAEIKAEVATKVKVLHLLLNVKAEIKR